jgi:hypothetical protein
VREMINGPLPRVTMIISLTSHRAARARSLEETAQGVGHTKDGSGSGDFGSVRHWKAST